MKKIKIENIECPACKGTGLYKGMCEKGGSAVVCHSCKGTGRTTFTYSYTEFTGKKKRDDVNRVYSGSHGYVLTDKDITTDEGKKIEFSKAGCSYEDWLKGKEPVPVKDLYCPYSYTNQRLQTNDVNDLYKTRCSKALGFGLISACKLNCEKHVCWEIFEGKQQWQPKIK
jgi:hypothetical protein